MKDLTQTFYEQNHFENLHLTEPFLKYLGQEEQELKRAINGGTVLDIGCGNGRSTALLADVADKVIGLDSNKVLLDQAKLKLKSRNNVRLYLENASSMHFGNQCFDYIVMVWNTFGNLNSTKDMVLLEVKRVLKPGGKLLMGVLSENCLPAYFEMLKRSGLSVKSYDENYVFLHEGLVSERFAKEKLERILCNNGFEPEIKTLTEISYWCEATR